MVVVVGTARHSCPWCKADKGCIWRIMVRRVSLLPHLGDYIKPIATQMSEKRAKWNGKKLTHKYATTLKSFWWKVRIVENQTKRSKQKVIVLRGKEPKIKSKRIRSTKTRKTHTWRKTGLARLWKWAQKVLTKTTLGCRANTRRDHNSFAKRG